ncbi:uncharacterized protein F5891DRAFT_985958 [Suillus fuscotomentosus]|uniref:Uncharacterized protein n=1 Tax=Suillus fuscotomentosus TaxID=1912939 RepID=A0AAD4DTC8_9AGAM|nr:uncharacterized protein F5891DRAFT_985958 [Suillus fuscotomentosus]KAG1893377.1 hypothetical protein F5891DRAFT_985958 [Suillus fuscotomentosus]
MSTPHYGSSISGLQMDSYIDVDAWFGVCIFPQIFVVYREIAALRRLTRSATRIREELFDIRETMGRRRFVSLGYRISNATTLAPTHCTLDNRELAFGFWTKWSSSWLRYLCWHLPAQEARRR